MSPSTRAGVGPGLLIACLLVLAPGVQAQDEEPGTQYVTFWRGELRIHALRANTRVTLIELNSGAPLDPANWTGNFSTNPFVLLNAGDSFEGDSGFQEQRVRIIAEDDTGAGGINPVTAWTGDLAPAVRHPVAPPPVDPPPNAWASYIPDVVQPGIPAGSEIGTTFLGFTSRDLLIVVQKDGTGPVSVLVEDLVTNADTDSDDTVTLDLGSPWLLHSDAEIEAYRLNAFEDDTIRITVTGGRASVLSGLWDVGLSDWSASPPSYRGNDNGRELGTLFYVYATRWLTIFPVFSDTTVTLTDLSDGDDSTVMVLPRGGRISPFIDMYISDVFGDSGLQAIPRADFPIVTFNTPPNAPIDDDLIRIESNRPILVYVGAVSSNVREFADVAYSIPVSESQRFVHAFAQNGGANDLQIFSFDDTNIVNIRSLSYTQGFQTQTNHDFNLPFSTPWAGGNSGTNDWFWFSDIWDAELLRITSQGPIQVMNGDYDGPNFGAFLTWVPRSSSAPPIANAGPDLTVCPDQLVTLSGAESFDADAIVGGQSETWEWDLDIDFDTDANGDSADDVDATGETVMASFPEGVTTVQLTYTDDDGESSTDQIVVTAADVEAPILDCPRNVRGTAVDFEGGPASPLVPATDDCDPMPVVVNDRTAGGSDASDTYPCGVTPVTFTATDASGKESSCTLAVVIEPDGGFPSVGAVLRVSKDGLRQPLLDWTLASGLPADARYLVLRSVLTPSVRDAAPWSGELTVETWTDTAAEEPLIFYDVRYVKCDGGTGGN